MRLVTPKWDETPGYWPQIEPWITAALSHGSIMYTPREVYNSLISRNMKLWLAFDGEELKACAVSHVFNYSVAKCLNFLAAGGSDADEWLRFDSVICEYARLLDCEQVEFVGRDGWRKKAAPYGYRAVATVFRKAI
jgi:hypothetical protein